ncbi:hypothetical protein [Rhizobium leucaenae]|uniref:hypothetical protein n=1 Tax=Rhizobium leucaenae TaxID=29450 RepID=UPI0007EE8619|nr:hypothetical protein [Rhizobium leucaenae]
MSRQTERAEARHQAKVDKANGRVAARPALKATGYPPNRYLPVQSFGKKYPFSSARQNAKYARVHAGHQLLQAAA